MELFPCPVCRNKTLSSDDHLEEEICIVCGWHDNIVQFEDPYTKAGPNHISLNEAKKNYQNHGSIYFDEK